MTVDSQSEGGGLLSRDPLPMAKEPAALGPRGHKKTPLRGIPVEGAILPTLAKLGPEELDAVLGKLSEEDAAQLEREQYDWSLWARAEQLPPVTAWRVWLMLAGRGGGKATSLDTPLL